MRAKRTITCMFILLLMLATMPVHVQAEEDTTIYSFGHFYYHSHNGYVSICGYLGGETEVEIPSVLSGRPVSEIESDSFNGCNTIETIIVPDTVVLVYEDSFTGAASLTKIISHTVGVELQADSSVTIEYVNESKNEPAGDTTPSEPEKPAEEPAEEPAEPVNPSEKPAIPTEEPEPAEPMNPAEVTPSSEQPPAGSNEPETTTPPDSVSDSSDTSAIGDYVYEETDDETGKGSDHTSPDTTTDTTPDATTVQPEGIRIPDSDIVVTVDKNGDLVQLDSKGNKILLDSEKKYQIEKNADGTMTIKDEDGKEVKVTEEGNVLFGDIIEEEIADNNSKNSTLIWAAAILGIGIVAVGVGFAVKKKTKTP